MGHRRCLDGALDALELGDDIVWVIHDWGSALGFHWTHRFPERVSGLCYMEGIRGASPSWAQWPEAARGVFQGFRSDKGEAMVLDKNVFVERVLPGSILRPLSETEMDHYRAPFITPGEDRRPTLTWPRQIPLDGEPADRLVAGREVERRVQRPEALLARRGALASASAWAAAPGSASRRADGNDVCYECEAQTQLDGSGECSACTRGYERPLGAASCTACALGDVQADAGEACSMCEAGKYSPITFFPKGLYEQFRRVANLYFLSVAIISLFDAISPIKPFHLPFYDL